MTFIDKLKAHVGGLIRIKTQLHWWCPPFGPDTVSERVCLLLDAQNDIHPVLISATLVYADQLEGKVFFPILILVDGQPKWIWVMEEVLELLK